MTKQILSLAIFACITVPAQIYTSTGSINGTTTNPTTNYIGIGTNTPTTALDVNGLFKVSLGYSHWW